MKAGRSWAARRTRPAPRRHGTDDISYAYQATFEGFLQQEAAAPADGLAQRADLLARTIRPAFENDRAIPDTELRDVAAAATVLLTDLIDADYAEPGLHRNAGRNGQGWPARA